MSDSVSLKERVVGSLLGGAIGDAWGSPYENRKGPLRFSISDYLELTDDTQFTLATCESVLEHGDAIPENIAGRFCELYQQGRVRGIGAGTLKAMRDLAAGIHWAQAGATGEYAAGTGAAMRVAPLAFLTTAEGQLNRTLLRDVCRITHRNDEAYAGALAIAACLNAITRGAWSAERSFLQIAAESIPDSSVRDRILELHSFTGEIAQAGVLFGTSGYVVDAVPFSLFCAQKIQEKPLLAVLAETIQAGGDTDTIASMTGQLAGCVQGTSEELQTAAAKIEESAEMFGVIEGFGEWVEEKLRSG